MIGMAARAARQAAGEHVQQQADAEALVAPAARPAAGCEPRGSFRGRPGRSSAGLRVEQPALGHRDALVEGDAHLALGDDAGADVEDDRVAVGRDAEAERVGADAAPRRRAGRRRRPKPWLLTVARKASASAAAASAYSPSRPMWPQCSSVPAARPSARALGISRSSSRWAWTWPRPHWPSATQDGRRLVDDLQRRRRACSSPSSQELRYCRTRIRPCESWPHRLASTRLPATMPAPRRRQTRRPRTGNGRRTAGECGRKVGTAATSVWRGGSSSAEGCGRPC